MKSITRKLLSLFIFTLFLIITTNLKVFAVAEEHGYLEYDYDSKTETFVPVEEFSNPVSQTDHLLTSRSQVSDVEETPAYTPPTLLMNEQLRSVIGEDERTIVNPTVSPYSRIVALRLGQDTNGDGKADTWYLGTGFMEGPDCFVTAGHCMWNGEEFGNVEEMRLYPKQNGSIYGNVFYYPKHWILPIEFKNGDSNYDWCIARLWNNIGDTLGWFGKSTGSRMNENIIVGGYPADFHGKQVSSNGTVTFVNEYKIKYNADTAGGSSGGPVYADNGMVYAIHTTGRDTYNAGVRITKRMFDVMQQYYLEGMKQWH